MRARASKTKPQSANGAAKTLDTATTQELIAALQDRVGSLLCGYTDLSRSGADDICVATHGNAATLYGLSRVLQATAATALHEVLTGGEQ